jgi:DNA-binding MarR family transcriptional regulator
MAEIEHELRLLEEIARKPDTTQADLAARLGIAVGSVNWYLKRLVKKGYVTVTQLQRRRLRYLITPRGMAERAQLTYQYMQASLHVYRQVRQEAQRLLEAAQEAGYEAIRIQGDNDTADICYLTCLDLGLQLGVDGAEVPTLHVEGMELVLTWPHDRPSLQVRIKPWVKS